MTEETVAAVPDPRQLDTVRDRVREQLRAEGTAAALGVLEPLNDADQAEVLLMLGDEERGPLLADMAAKRLAGILDHLDAEEAVAFARLMPPDRLGAVLDEAPANIAADIVRGIEWTIARQALAHMTNRRAVGSLLLYPDDDAGGLMTPEVVGLRDTLSASQALNSLRLSDYRPDQLSQIFVVDQERRLAGYLSLPEIVFAAPFAKLRDIMHEDVVSVRTGTDQEECARLMRRYDLRSLPVVDDHGRLEGAISIEDLVEVAEEEATEDMFKMVGSGVQDSPNAPVWRRARIRLPWLLANLVTALAAGAVLGIFEDTLDRMAVLAVFLPVIMGHAGITGTQAVTVIVRSLALNEIGPGDTRRLLLGEVAFGVIHGLVVGVLLALAVFAWQRDPALAGLVAVAMVANLLVASIAGVVVPMMMKLFRVDPATSSTSFLTTVTDIAGILLYLGPATLLLAVFAAR